MLRVVLDANQFVSSLLVKVGLPAQALDVWRVGAYQLLVSPAILEEVEHTLGYERIRGCKQRYRLIKIESVNLVVRANIKQYDNFLG